MGLRSIRELMPWVYGVRCLLLPGLGCLVGLGMDKMVRALTYYSYCLCFKSNQMIDGYLMQCCDLLLL